MIHAHGNTKKEESIMKKTNIPENVNEEIKTGGLEILANDETTPEEESKAVEPETPVQEEKPVEPEVTEIPEVPEEPKKPMIGVVVNCQKLNVRRRPRIDPNPASVIAVLKALTEVEIDEKKSTDDFYKIFTAAGVEGFCMKKFIAIR
jgi:outer membrane biosynthesis protein TonB